MPDDIQGCQSVFLILEVMRCKGRLGVWTLRRHIQVSSMYYTSQSCFNSRAAEALFSRYVDLFSGFRKYLLNLARDPLGIDKQILMPGPL